jgi:hypothetical protein
MGIRFGAGVNIGVGGSNFLGGMNIGRSPIPDPLAMTVEYLIVAGGGGGGGGYGTGAYVEVLAVY